MWLVSFLGMEGLWSSSLRWSVWIAFTRMWILKLSDNFGINNLAADCLSIPSRLMRLPHNPNHLSGAGGFMLALMKSQTLQLYCLSGFFIVWLFLLFFPVQLGIVEYMPVVRLT